MFLSLFAETTSFLWNVVVGAFCLNWARDFPILEHHIISRQFCAVFLHLRWREVTWNEFDVINWWLNWALKVTCTLISRDMWEWLSIPRWFSLTRHLFMGLWLQTVHTISSCTIHQNEAEQGPYVNLLLEHDNTIYEINWSDGETPKSYLLLL